ncbi:MAG TPA: hypothetical protein VND93_18085 [Myxococcales bacterium]|nr:hypothetical protein [Myxococcales bacterium]
MILPEKLERSLREARQALEQLRLTLAERPRSRRAPAEGEDEDEGEAPHSPIGAGHG